MLTSIKLIKVVLKT